MPRRKSQVRGLAALLAAASALAVTGGGLVQPTEARAEASGELSPGQQLEALDNVIVARAEIAKGSRVNVIKILQRQGRLASVDVELADGAVARVAIAVVRASFRVVSE